MSVLCPNCQAQNRDDAKFCTYCGATLPACCPNCSFVNPVGAKFCAQCATPLAGQTPQGGLVTGALRANAVLVNRYTILTKLGQGGMGAVYLAQDQRLIGRKVAIKEMSEAGLTDPQERQRAVQAFRQEAHMLALLDHAHLPKVSDTFAENGRQYLVMDFIDGETLERRLTQANRPLDTQEVVTWAVQLCDVLEYLHTQQPPIVFRDLKPANIMIDRAGRVKLIDFGIARHFKPAQGRDTAPFGSAGYAPPEQYGKGQTDARSDIYALGATLHQALTNRDPAQSPFQFPSIQSVNQAVPYEVEQIIMKALQQNADGRWQSAGEMRAALAQANKRDALFCPQCGLRNAATELYCQGCAHQLVGSRACPHCRGAIPIGAVFCARCGRKV